MLGGGGGMTEELKTCDFSPNRKMQSFALWDVSGSLHQEVDE